MKKSLVSPVSRLPDRCGVFADFILQPGLAVGDLHLPMHQRHLTGRLPRQLPAHPALAPALRPARQADLRCLLPVIADRLQMSAQLQVESLVESQSSQLLLLVSSFSFAAKRTRQEHRHPLDMRRLPTKALSDHLRTKRPTWHMLLHMELLKQNQLVWLKETTTLQIPTPKVLTIRTWLTWAKVPLVPLQQRWRDNHPLASCLAMRQATFRCNR